MSIVDHLVPLGVGVAGLGRAGLCHLERITLRADFRLVAAYDLCANAAHKTAGFAARTASSWNDLLADNAIELVLVATPPASHASLVIEALSAGKHVLVETPLCLDLPAADAILAAQERSGRSVIVAQTRRWDSDFLTARQCLASGALGRVLAVRQVSWQYNLPARSAVAPTAHGSNEETGPLAPHDWRKHSTTGGGLLWESGAHALDQLLQLVGEPPASVSAELITGPEAREADDGFLVQASFPSGVRAHVEFNRAWPVTLQTGWVVVGSAGSYADGLLLTVTPDGEVVDQPLSPVKRELDELYAAVVRHIRDGEPNPAPAEQARQTVALIEAARRAAQCGRPVPVAG
jgi:scyllo-inositol 2-dehydrogenase (NADP+)